MIRLNLSIVEFCDLIVKHQLPIMMNGVGVSNVLWFKTTIDSFCAVRWEGLKMLYTPDMDLNARYRVDVSIHEGKCIFINQFISL